MSPSLPLDQPLPTAMRTSGDGWWMRYRHYPVFSTLWWRGRSVRFGVVIAAWASLVGISLGFSAHNVAVGLQAAAPLFLAFMVVSCLGPALATAVRRFGWTQRWENCGILLAIALGVVTSFVADNWASLHVMAALQQAQIIPPGTLQPPATAKLVTTVINAVARLAIYAAVGGGLAWAAYRNERQRWENDRREAELKALREQRQLAEWQLGVLQAQIEPHFLFNTLASIRALIPSEPARAEHAIDTLVDYLRGIIPRLREQGDGIASTLGEQLDLCADYLELMHVRSGGRLCHAVEVDRALRARRFPPLLLLTLAENAIKHGVEPRPGPGMVTLRVQATGDVLRVCVIDDGQGLRTGISQGVGLHNLQKQLEARYGGAARFALCPRAGGGTEAVLDIPDEGDA